MNVADLILKLSEFDPATRVAAYAADEGYCTLNFEGVRFSQDGDWFEENQDGTWSRVQRPHIRIIGG